MGHLLLDLRDGAEDVPIVLLEAADAREAGERARDLVAVEHAEVADAYGKLAVRTLACACEHASSQRPQCSARLATDQGGTPS